MNEQEIGTWKEVEEVTKLFNDIRFDADYDEDQTGVVMNAILGELLV